MNRTTGPIQPLAVVGVALLALPVIGLVASAPWSQMPDALADARVGRAIGVSLGTSVLATGIVAIFGVPLGWVFARNPAWRWLRPVCLVPLVLPPVVGGMALQYLWGPPGIIGRALATSDILIPFSAIAVVLSQVFVAMPFCVLAVETAVRGIDPRAEEIAQVYGLSGFRLFRRVMLPLALPGILTGLLVAFARALGEFGATITFAGNLPGRTQTMPLAVVDLLQSDPAAAVAISLMMLLVSIGVLVALRGRLGITT